MLVRSLDGLDKIIAGDGCILREILNPAMETGLGGIGYSLAHAIVPVGAFTAPHRLTSCEVYYILAGTGLMYIDSESESVKPSDTVLIPPGAVQHIENTGDIDLEFICIVDPAWTPSCETVMI
jgi:mannose-6-phosphate isomerase-like protein (cupin superfamily)